MNKNMKKQYLAPMSAQMVMNITRIMGSSATDGPASDLTPGGSTAGGTACAPGRKLP